IWLVGADDGETVSADDFAQGVADGECEGIGIAVFAAMLLVMFADQMREDLGIRGGLEGVAKLGEFVFEPVVIFNDAVVNDGYPSGLVQVRVRIFIRGRPVSRPTGVGNAEASFRWLLLQSTCQALVNSALFLSD